MVPHSWSLSAPHTHTFHSVTADYYLQKGLLMISCRLVGFVGSLKIQWTSQLSAS